MKKHNNNIGLEDFNNSVGWLIDFKQKGFIALENSITNNNLTNVKDLIKLNQIEFNKHYDYVNSFDSKIRMVKIMQSTSKDIKYYADVVFDYLKNKYKIND
jgi:hypothetical protein